MKRLADIIFVGLTVAVLVLLAFVTVFQESPDYLFYENRMAAQTPALTGSTLSDGSYFSDLETYLTDHAAGRDCLTKLDTAISLSVLHRPVVNDIFVQDDILLPFLDYEVTDEDTLAQQAAAVGNNLSTISQAVGSYGGTYCYVILPGQYSYFADRYPAYLNNRSAYLDTSVQIMSKLLEERGILSIDLGTVYKNTDTSAALYSAVDHHYSAQAAFLACQTILETLNQECGSNFPILTEDDLSFTPVSRHYLGSRARKIFDFTDIEEQLYTMNVKNAVPFTRTDNGSPVASSVYTLPVDPEEPVTYSYFMGGDVANTQIDTQREALPTVLIYGDSYTNALESILYLSCDRMDSLDLRYPQEGTLTDYILKTQPDYVICLRDYSVLLSTDGNGGT